MAAHSPLLPPQTSRIGHCWPQPVTFCVRPVPNEPSYFRCKFGCCEQCNYFIINNFRPSHVASLPTACQQFTFLIPPPPAAACHHHHLQTKLLFFVTHGNLGLNNGRSSVRQWIPNTIWSYHRALQGQESTVCCNCTKPKAWNKSKCSCSRSD